ncbi:MAG: hypothetical protein ACLFMN_08240 [Desulfobacterales bacterium]
MNPFVLKQRPAEAKVVRIKRADVDEKDCMFCHMRKQNGHKAAGVISMTMQGGAEKV